MSERGEEMTSSQVEDRPRYSRKEVSAERHRDQVRRANRARKKAIDLLIAAHPVEYDRLYAEIAEKNGVSPSGRRGAPKADQIQAEIDRLQEKLDRMTEATG